MLKNLQRRQQKLLQKDQFKKKQKKQAVQLAINFLIKLERLKNVAKNLGAIESGKDIPKERYISPEKKTEN